MPARTKLLNVPYMHVVFTLPHGLLFREASGTKTMRMATHAAR